MRFGTFRHGFRPFAFRFGRWGPFGAAAGVGRPFGRMSGRPFVLRRSYLRRLRRYRAELEEELREVEDELRELEREPKEEPAEAT